jgi:DNA polymerase-1
MAWRQIWVVDFEFCKDRYGRPDPICLSARELYSGRTVSMWRDQLGPAPPYDIGPDSLFVCYSGSEAELACHLALGWPLPCNAVDLITEYRLAICGEGNEKDLSLLAALARCGITAAVSAAEKKRAQQRCMQGWPFSAEDVRWIQGYCDTDVIEETELLCKLGLPAASDHAVWRGEFTKEVARMWWRGVPIDPPFRELVEDREAWHELLEWIITHNQSEFPVFAGQTTKQKELFEKWLTGLGIPVPRTAAGRVSIALNVLARLAAEHEELRSFEEGRRILGQLHDLLLPIFADDRLRAWFAPFWTITSRAAPPTNGYIYNLPAWMRAMMSPPKGCALAYLDYEAMEFGLSGWRSGCPNMRVFYAAGDPYINTGIAFGGMPAGATKATHRISALSTKPAGWLAFMGSAPARWRGG